MGVLERFLKGFKPFMREWEYPGLPEKYFGCSGTFQKGFKEFQKIQVFFFVFEGSMGLQESLRVAGEGLRGDFENFRHAMVFQRVSGSFKGIRWGLGGNGYAYRI